MYSSLKKLLLFGIKPNDNNSDIRLKKVLNIASLVGTISIITVSITDLNIHSSSTSTVLLWAIPIFMFSPLFNLKNRSEIGFTILSLTGNALVFLFSIANGEASYMHMFFIVIIFGHTLLFVGEGTNWYYYINLFITILVIVLLLLAFEYNWFDKFTLNVENSYDNMQLNFIVLTVCSIVFSIIIGYSFLEQYSMLRNKINDKDVLLAEVNHRVKNNMAIMVGLMRLKERYTSHEETKEVLQEMHGRIFTMATIHQKLYELDGSSFIKMPEFLDQFNEKKLTRQRKEVLISLNENMPNQSLSVTQAIPLGMIINELINNSIKHGFKDVENPEINLSLNTDSEGKIHIIYRDNGIGFDENEVENAEEVGIGLELITSLSDQLDGSYHFHNDGGLCYELKFHLNNGSEK